MSKLDYPRRNAQLFRPADPAKDVSTNILMETDKVVLARVETRHGKHKDAEAHKIKMRDRMRAKRATA